MRRLAMIAGGSVMALASACGRGGASSAGTRASAEVPPAGSAAEVASAKASVDAGLAPLRAEWFERLDLPGGDVAFVTVPLGATEPRPIVVALHGAGDRPEWSCSGWHGVTEGYPFIVCPRGTPASDGRFYWGSSAQMKRIIELAIPALRARYGPYVADGPRLLAGFSAGTIYGSELVKADPKTYPRAMFSEGGYGQLDDPSFAAAFAKNGGERVLLGCSTAGSCGSRLGAARLLLTRAGVGARLNDAGNVGHNLNMEAVTSLRRDWPWLVEGDPAWATYPRAIAANRDR